MILKCNFLDTASSEKNKSLYKCHTTRPGKTTPTNLFSGLFCCETNRNTPVSATLSPPYRMETSCKAHAWFYKLQLNEASTERVSTFREQLLFVGSVLSCLDKPQTKVARGFLPKSCLPVLLQFASVLPLCSYIR